MLNNKINIQLNDSYFIDNINNIILEECININNSIDNIEYQKYIYEVNNDKSKYIFNGFYKEGFLIVTIDSFNTFLDTHIEHKNVFLFKVNWILKNNIFLVDIPNNTVKISESYILPIRKNILQNFYIQNYFKTNKINKIESHIKKNILYIIKEYVN